MRLFFFPSQDASEDKPEDAIAPLTTANPMRFKASRRLILLFVFMFSGLCLRCKVTQFPLKGTYKKHGLNYNFSCFVYGFRKKRKLFLYFVFFLLHFVSHPVLCLHVGCIVLRCFASFLGEKTPVPR